MLEPRERRLLLDALRPPEGHRLTDALGVTYTLDLLALLTTPLSFALFDWEDAEGRPVADPLAVLEAIRRHADHMHVFCQAGMIRVPPADQRLLGWLERCVVEVRPPPDGIFHPKAWILRFEADHEGEPVRYRVLVSTRNLTFDRSWDTLLVLDGELRDRSRSVSGSAPLAEFLRDLPRRALHQPVPPRVSEQVERLADEVRRVVFEAPPPFEEVWFEPLGVPQEKPRALDLSAATRLLVVSPFLSADALVDVVKPRDGDVLVSRAESLDATPPDVLRSFGKVYALADGADGEAGGEQEQTAETLLRGLHAKLYVADEGWDATVWTGSANATGSLLGRSVELLVGLRGKKSKCGVSTFLSEDDRDRGFLNLLTPYTPPKAWTPPEDPLRALEDALDALRRSVAEAGISLRVATAGSPDAFDVDVVLGSKRLALPDGATLSCRPATLRPDAGQRIGPGTTSLAFRGVSAPALTTFLAFHASIARGGRRAEAEFVLNVPAEGMPADRRDRLLRDILADRQHVLRLLLLLLAESGADIQGFLKRERGEEKRDGAAGLGGEDLFEQLVRALHRRPQRIREVKELVEELRRTPEGAALLPVGFDSIFGPVLAAWQERGA